MDFYITSKYEHYMRLLIWNTQIFLSVIFQFYALLDTGLLDMM